MKNKEISHLKNILAIIIILVAFFSSIFLNNNGYNLGLIMGCVFSLLIIEIYNK